MLRQRWLGAAPVILLSFLGITAFTAFKIAIPDIVPFYADRMRLSSTSVSSAPACRKTGGKPLKSA